MQEPSLAVLSGPAQWVTGNSALVQARLPSGLAWSNVSLRLGTQEQPALTPGSSSLAQGLVQGLPAGQSTLSLVRRQDGQVLAQLTLNNWPQQGPVFAGERSTPFYCQTSSFTLPDGQTLGPAQDADCGFASRVHYLYQAQGGTSWQVLTDTRTLPADVGWVTTSAGLRRPLVVRVETAAVDRGIYQSAVLHDPTQEAEPSPTQPPRAWNGRLIAITGLGCTPGWYVQGASQGSTTTAALDFQLLSPSRLAEGNALFANTLMHPGNNCNTVLASEAALMSKEYFIKRHGVPRVTVGGGVSGGGYTALAIADRLPGLLDGVLVANTFPDALAVAVAAMDARLLAYQALTQQPDLMTAAQWLGVAGFKHQDAWLALAREASRTDPTPGRAELTGMGSALFNAAVPTTAQYHPQRNPSGLRGSLFDSWLPLLGTDPDTGWAGRPFDNVGVQYGWQALQRGDITPEQFVRLNETIGGLDANSNRVPQRSAANPQALRVVQEAGLHLSGVGGLARIPVFMADTVYNENNDYHAQWARFAVRDRLQAANGHTDNVVMWRGNPAPGAQAWQQFTTWVDAVANDTRAVPAIDKVRQHRPSADGCWNGAGRFLAEPQTLSSEGDSTCNRLYPAWRHVRAEAGGPISGRILKCTLKPVEAADYPANLSTSQLARLRQVFPDGVCDWARSQPQSLLQPGASWGPAR